MINKVTIIGNLGQDPQVRRLENGTAVAKLNVATSENYKNAAGEWVDKTEWHNVVLWGKLAEAAEAKRKKGDMVYIEGKLSTRKWTDDKDIVRYTTEIVGAYLRNIPRQKSNGSFPTAADAPPAEPRETPLNDTTAAPEEVKDLPF